MRLLCFTLLLATTSLAVAAEPLDVWVGTTTPRDGQPAGIYYLSLNAEEGKLSPAALAVEQSGAGFLVKHPTLPVLYSTGEGVSSWKIVGEKTARRLEKLNSQETGDGGAAHIAVDRTGKVLLSAQYGGGSVASYPLQDDGSIGERVSLIEHDDPSGVVPNRQAACHPHWVGTSPDNRYVLAPDLGADKIYVHQLDAETGELTPHGSVDTPPGGGPRHFKFLPSGQFGYLINELTVTVSAFRWDEEAGQLTLIQTVPALSEQQKSGQRHNSGSEIRVHPEGKFVYAANRGHDSVTAFAVNSETGELTLIEQESIRGSWPRNFNLDPSGQWLLAAGRDSNTLALFAVDQQTGRLTYTLETATVPAPICVVVE